MSNLARARRWARFVDRRTQRVMLVPMDHGLTLGPIPGLADPVDIKEWLDPDLVTGVVVHKGMAERMPSLNAVGLMIHLNGAVTFDEAPHVKRMLTSVEAAVRMGADAVSIQTNFDGRTSAHNVQLMGRVVDEAHAMGMPVLNMVYDAESQGSKGVDRLKHCLRVSVELGVDAIKIAPPKSLDDIPALLEGIASHTPVLLAGGELDSDEALVELARALHRNGAAGFCVGRNIFQRPRPADILRQLRSVFLGTSDPSTALRKNDAVEMAVA